MEVRKLSLGQRNFIEYLFIFFPNIDRNESSNNLEFSDSQNGGENASTAQFVLCSDLNEGVILLFQRMVSLVNGSVAIVDRSEEYVHVDAALKRTLPQLGVRTELVNSAAE